MTYSQSKLRLVPFGNVLRVVKDELSLHREHQKQLELVDMRKRNNNSGNPLVTGKHSRHNLVIFPRHEPIVIKGREFTRLGIAKAVGCDIGHISKIFIGQRTPSLFMAKKIAAVIEMTTDEFYDLLTRIDVGQTIEPEDRLRRPLTFQPVTGNL